MGFVHCVQRQNRRIQLQPAEVRAYCTYNSLLSFLSSPFELPPQKKYLAPMQVHSGTFSVLLWLHGPM